MRLLVVMGRGCQVLLLKREKRNERDFLTIPLSGRGGAQG